MESSFSYIEIQFRFWENLAFDAKSVFGYICATTLA